MKTKPQRSIKKKSASGPITRQDIEDVSKEKLRKKGSTPTQNGDQVKGGKKLITSNTKTKGKQSGISRKPSVTQDRPSESDTNRKKSRTSRKLSLSQNGPNKHMALKSKSKQRTVSQSRRITRSRNTCR